MRRRPGYDLLGLTALLNYALVAVVWATHEPDRLLQPVFVCLVPLCLAGPFAAAHWLSRLQSAQGREARRRLAWLAGVVVAAFVVSTAFWYYGDLVVLRRYLVSRPAFVPLSRDERAWANSQLLSDTVIASDDPFVCNWRLDRPTIYFPDALDQNNAADFFRRYKVRYVSIVGGQAPDMRERLNALVTQGVLQPVAQGLDPGFQWFSVNESIFLSSPSK
jgi:hypothetical protein